MKDLVRALLAALLFHLAVVIVLLAVRVPVRRSGGVVEVAFEPPPIENKEAPAPSTRRRAAPEAAVVTVAPPAAVPLPSDTLSAPPAPSPRPADVLRSASDTLRLQAARRWALFHQPLPDSILAPPPQQALMERLARYGPSVGDVHALPPRDRAGEELSKRATGHGGLADLGSLLRKIGIGRTPTASGPVRITREPTVQELHVLRELWAATTSTAPDLYRQLDAAVAPNAERLNQLLDEMTERGLLGRRLVSPQDLLTVTTPFGSMEVERNQLNRRNRIYQYWPAVSREDVLHYLQGALLREAENDSTAEARRRLAEKLRLLALPR
ncbi:MAG: hypothetical protein ACUVWA_08770 [Candidatus Oleimicrobiaceae bacterium]